MTGAEARLGLLDLAGGKPLECNSGLHVYMSFSMELICWSCYNAFCGPKKVLASVRTIIPQNIPMKKKNTLCLVQEACLGIFFLSSLNPLLDQLSL